MLMLVRRWLAGVHPTKKTVQLSQNFDSNQVKSEQQKMSKQDYRSDQTFDAIFLYLTVSATSFGTQVVLKFDTQPFFPLLLCSCLHCLPASQFLPVLNTSNFTSFSKKQASCPSFFLTSSTLSPPVPPWFLLYGPQVALVIPFSIMTFGATPLQHFSK